MKKRILSLLTAVTILSSLFAGCSGKEPAKEPAASTPKSEAESSGAENPEPAPSSGQKITVLLPNHEMDTVGFMERETRQFEQETGIQVELINMGWDNVADRVTTEMAAGGDSYDVIEFDNAWVPKFATNDWVEPLDSFITPEMKEGILPGLLDKFSYNGHIYGIAWNNDTRFFMYNKAKLDEAGIPAPPKTFMELAQQSKTLQEKGTAKYGYIDSYMQAQSGANELCLLVYAFGGDFFDADGNLTITTDPGVKKAYEFLVDGLNQSKFIDPAALTSDYETVANVFNMGDTAFFVQAWPGIYQSANDPEVSKIVDQIAVADYALADEGSQQVVLTLPEAMAIPKTSKNKEAAWKYIQYMSSREFDKRKAQTIGALPIWKDLFNDPDLLEIYPHWASFGKQAEFSKGLPSLLWYDEFANILLVESQNILLGQCTVDEGLAAMEEQCKKLMQ